MFRSRDDDSRRTNKVVSEPRASPGLIKDIEALVIKRVRGFERGRRYLYLRFLRA